VLIGGFSVYTRSMKLRYSKRIILIASLIAIATALVIISVAKHVQAPQNSQNKHKSNNQTICTMDAKICPDGSSVGRSGPDCEFEPCPGEQPSNKQ